MGDIVQDPEKPLEVVGAFFKDTSFRVPTLTKTKPYVKQIKLRLFTDGNKSSKRATLRPPKGYNVMSRDQVLFNLWRVALEFTAKVPLHQYEIVEVGNAEFNFVWRGLRNGADEVRGIFANQRPTGEPGSVEDRGDTAEQQPEVA